MTQDLVSLERTMHNAVLQVRFFRKKLNCNIILWCQNRGQKRIFLHTWDKINTF